jgi:hypothetical protein
MSDELVGGEFMEQDKWEPLRNSIKRQEDRIHSLEAQLKDTEERLRKEEQACADLISNGNVLRRQLEEAKKFNIYPMMKELQSQNARLKDELERYKQAEQLRRTQ